MYRYSNSDAGQSSANESEALALLQHLDKNELQTLVDDPSKLDNLVKDSQQVKNMINEKETLVASNKSLAEFNLSLQPKLDDLKNRVATAYEEINVKKTDLGKDKAQLDMHIGEQSLDTMLALLQTECAKSEEESEQMADDFCQNKISVEDFISSYMSKRTVAHTRRVKVEKMTELLRNLHVQNHPTLHRQDPPPAVGPYRPPIPPRSNPGPVPYPVNNSFGMPQPSGYGYRP